MKYYERNTCKRIVIIATRTKKNILANGVTIYRYLNYEI